jgi:cell division septal protein FtsQ
VIEHRLERGGLGHEAVRRAQAVLDHLSAEEERAATYIDLSVPERPAIGGLGAPPTDDPETIE